VLHIGYGIPHESDTDCDDCDVCEIIFDELLDESLDELLDDELDELLDDELDDELDELLLVELEELLENRTLPHGQFTLSKSILILLSYELILMHLLPVSFFKDNIILPAALSLVVSFIKERDLGMYASLTSLSTKR
jgi:hypothetical protein